MTHHAATTFAVKHWDEKPYAEFDEGRKLTRAAVTYTYTGDLQGEGQVEYLMAYNPDGSGHAIALERVMGSLGGRPGSFVVQHTGTFQAIGVKNHWFILPGSGTGELRGLTGGGEFEIAGQGPYSIAFDYGLA